MPHPNIRPHWFFSKSGFSKSGVALNWPLMPSSKTASPLLLLALTLVLTLAGPGAQTGVCGPYPRKTAVVEAVQKVSPAVVNISSKYDDPRRRNPFSRFKKIDPFFDSFFKEFFDSRPPEPYTRTHLGSGVIIDGHRGYILTNAHVVAKAGSITVALKDQREFEASIVGVDPDSDLSVLKISSKTPLPEARMGDSKDIMPGETVIAIGNPFGFSNTVTTGVVSALNRSVKAEDRVYRDFIQTDASINPGNSGGPLLNINGQLIGINTAIYAKAQGIGFAIPINRAKRIVSDLIKYGEVVPAWFGIGAQDMDESLFDYLKQNKNAGVMVIRVEKNSPAFAAGVKQGDVIQSMNSRTIQSKDDYDALTRNVAAGDRATFVLWRKRKKITATVKTVVFPKERALAFARERFGIDIENLNLKNRYSHRIHASVRGVVVTRVDALSYLGKIGVAPGDVIRRINDVKINDSEDFKKAVVKYRTKSSMVFLVFRGERGYHITVEW